MSTICGGNCGHGGVVKYFGLQDNQCHAIRIERYSNVATGYLRSCSRANSSARRLVLSRLERPSIWRIMWRSRGAIDVTADVNGDSRRVRSPIVGSWHRYPRCSPAVRVIRNSLVLQRLKQVRYVTVTKCAATASGYSLSRRSSSCVGQVGCGRFPSRFTKSPGSEESWQTAKKGYLKDIAQQLFRRLVIMVNLSRD
jgi:hypothetical protein